MPSNSSALVRAHMSMYVDYVSLHLSQYPSISSADQAGKSAGHPSLTTQCRKSSASPPVTRYSVFFWLLIFHTSPLTVSWWSLRLYMVKAWLRSASSTARNYYFQCKSLSHRVRRPTTCKIKKKKENKTKKNLLRVTQDFFIFFLTAQFPLPYLCNVWLRFGLGLKFLPFGLSFHSKHMVPCPNYIMELRQQHRQCLCQHRLSNN